MGSNGESEPGWRLPADLAAALALTALVNVAAFAPVVRETPVRIPLGLAVLLFVPGYVVVAALFPGRRDVDAIDRLSLSVVASAVVVPAVGLVLNATPWGIRLGPMLVGVSLVIVVGCVLGTRRRLAVRPDERFRVPYREWTRQKVAVVRPNGGTDLALTLSLAVAVIVAVGAAGFAVADHHGYGPENGEDDAAAISLLDSDGDLLAESEATLEPGSAGSVFVGVDNYGGEPRSYIVLALERELADDGTVTDERELERFDVTVDDGERGTVEHELEPTAGGDVQFVWLLYPDAVPEEPSTDSADAYASLMVSGEEAPG
ncbi:DUF1616 domain-containing protein [Natronococcus occultus]|uniref:Putative membrane protein n=1 Tax=Natronococcus occultus SP4 TaxID=694430 RepID=L0K3Y7_9EURY|nr:DUF1616 domain-containing protein [Natronococcus occultus]AGB39265.1 putative membrane protein [Natronococcus occultus SP4]